MALFDEVIRESDVISVHVHLTEGNRGLIGANEFRAMKPGAILINTSRGAIIDEHALLHALESGQLGGAGLDVIEGEWRPDLDRHPLIQYSRARENLVITPHIGGVTHESQAMAYACTIRKLAEYFNQFKAQRFV
jgi:phosphoglycerate dehydrogenase-like enzyme